MLLLRLDVSSPSLVDFTSGAPAVSQGDLPQQAENRLQTLRVGWLHRVQSVVPTGTSHDSLIIISFTPWLSSPTHTPLSFFVLQVLTLDPGANTRQSDRTSGFTSPSHFSSPSFATQPVLLPRVWTPVSPDSMVEGSPHPADTDCISDTSSVSAAGPSPSKLQTLWGNVSQTAVSTPQGKTRLSHLASQQHKASVPLASEEEGSQTYTSTLKPRKGSGAALWPAAGPSLEDPVVLSL